jgi:glycosyltransferase 2 family protein
MKVTAQATTSSPASEEMSPSQDIDQTDPFQTTRLRLPSLSSRGPRSMLLQRFDSEKISLVVDIAQEVTVPVMQAIPSGSSEQKSVMDRAKEITALVMQPISSESSEWIKSVGQIEKKKKGTASKKIFFILRVGVTLLLFVFLFREISWSTLLSLLAHIQYTELLVGLCLGTLGVIFSAYLWHRLVLAESIQTDLSRLTSLYLIGVAFSHFLPTSMGGDAVKAFYVGRNAGNMTGSASAVLMSRITGFIGMLLVALPALIFLHEQFDQELVKRFLLLSLFFVASIGGTMVLAVFLRKIPTRLFQGTWAKNKMVVKVLETGTSMSRSMARPRTMIEAISFGILFWITNCLNYYEFAIALGLHVPLTFYLIAVPFVGMVGALPISISGFGVRENLVVYLYSTIHVPTTAALAVVLLMDMQRLFFGGLGGLLFLTMGDKAKSTQTSTPS